MQKLCKACHRNVDPYHFGFVCMVTELSSVTVLCLLFVVDWNIALKESHLGNLLMMHAASELQRVIVQVTDSHVKHECWYMATVSPSSKYMYLTYFHEIYIYFEIKRSHIVLWSRFVIKVCESNRWAIAKAVYIPATFQMTSWLFSWPAESFFLSSLVTPQQKILYRPLGMCVCTLTKFCY